MFALYRLFTDFIYLTNDDMYLQAIVSGEISGTPDAHMIYSNYILGIVLSFLYSCAAQIPWYGIYLLSVCFLCAWIILCRCLSRCEKWSNRMAVISLFVVISFCAVFRHIAMMQYTVVAAFAGGTAVFYAMTMDMNSASFFASSIFKSAEGDNGICDNLLPLSSWPNKSPLIAENLARYGVKDITGDLVDNEHVYFVFEDSEETPSQYLIDFFDGELEGVNVELNQADILKTDAGID